MQINVSYRIWYNTNKIPYWIDDLDIEYSYNNMVFNIAKTVTRMKIGREGQYIIMNTENFNDWLVAIKRQKTQILIEKEIQQPVIKNLEQNDSNQKEKQPIIEEPDEEIDIEMVDNEKTNKKRKISKNTRKCIIILTKSAGMCDVIDPNVARVRVKGLIPPLDDVKLKIWLEKKYNLRIYAAMANKDTRSGKNLKSAFLYTDIATGMWLSQFKKETLPVRNSRLNFDYARIKYSWKNVKDKEKKG